MLRQQKLLGDYATSKPAASTAALSTASVVWVASNVTVAWASSLLTTAKLTPARAVSTLVTLATQPWQVMPCTAKVRVCVGGTPRGMFCRHGQEATQRMELLEYRAPQRDRQRSAAAPQNVRFCTLRRSHNTRNGGGTRRVLPAALRTPERSFPNAFQGDAVTEPHSQISRRCRQCVASSPARDLEVQFNCFGFL